MFWEFILGVIFSGWGGRGFSRAGARRVAELAHDHAPAIVLQAEFVTWPGLDRETAATLLAVVADKNALSFRDQFDVELMRVSADEIVDLELVVEGGEHVRVRRSSAEPIAFWIDDRRGSQRVSRDDLQRALGLVDGPGAAP